jgi:hypothetical protein
LAFGLADNTPGIFRKSLFWGGLVLAASMGLCIGFDVYRQFDLRGPGHLDESYAWLDKLIRGAAEPGRGVFLRFDNFRGESAGFVTNIYFRAVYVMYPRPVLVAEPGVVVNKPFQLLENNSYPNEQWLRDQGVGSIMVWDFDPVSGRPFVRGVTWLGK